MFQNCITLTSLDISFNTAKVTDLSYTFDSCYSLRALDVSKFDTSLVTDFTSTFSGCRYVTSLDVSTFKTDNAKYMGFLFYSNQKITSLKC